MLNLSLIRRTVLTLSLFCLAASMAADSYHPYILKSQVVSLDVAAIERDAQSGTPFELAIGDIRLKVALSPAPVWPDEGLTVLQMGEDGAVKQSIVYGDITYAGDVVGEDPEASGARFGIAHGALEGYVLSSTGWWFFEPLSRFDPKAGPDQYLVYATRDLEFELPLSPDDVEPGDGVKEDRVVIPDPRIRVAMIADRDYVTRSGDSFQYFERQAMLINEINGIYKPQTGREFKMQLSAADFGGTKLTSKWRLILLNQLDSFLGLFGGLQNGLFSHIAHLTTGKNLEGDWLEAFGGNSIGLSQQGFIPANGGTPGQARLLAYQNMMMVAHVFGHNFNAFGSLADKWCVLDIGICLDYERSLMWETFYSDNNPRFSDGTRDPSHNNRQRVRDNMTSRGF